MKHRGEILKKRFEESGLKIAKVAKETGISRQSIYRLFDNSKVDVDTIIKFAKALKWDWRKDFPELSGRTPEDEENLSYKIKYFDLLERYSQLMEQQMDYEKKKNSKLKKGKG